MKRGCLLIVLGCIAIVIIVIGVSLYALNRQVGLFPAQVTSHEIVTTPETRFRLVFKPEHLGDVITPFLPDASELPTWLPFDPESALALMMPYEVALLSTANFEASQLNLTLFVNERRGGPVLLSLLRDANFNVNLQGFDWHSEPFTYPRRGVLLGHARLAIPDGVEFTLLDYWSHALPDSPLSVAKDHLLAGVLDNRNGELLTMLLTLIEANEGNWQEALEDSRMETFLEVLVDIYALYLHADLEDNDTLAGQLRVEAAPEIQPDLTFLSNMVLLPMLANYIQTELRLHFSGEAVWDVDAESLLVNFEIQGLEDWIATLAAGEAPPPVTE